MDTLLKLNNQTNGRDKLARLLQYTTKLLWHQLDERYAAKHTVERLKYLELTFGSFRKLLRLGRCVDFGYMALNSMNLENPILRVTLTTSKLAQALFLYSDHLVWLTRSGLVRGDTDKWAKRANKFWLLSIIANLLRDLYEILYILELNQSSFLKPSLLLDANIGRIDIQSSTKYVCNLITCHKDVFIDSLKNSCDLFIPLTALGFVKLSPSTIGALGAISSMAALLTIVDPITKLVPA